MRSVRRSLLVVGVIAIFGVTAAAALAIGWGNAIEVPGTAALNTGNDANTTSISCPSTGDCAAGGYYTDGSFHRHGFVVDEKTGVWDDAAEIPDLASLDAGGDAQVNAISCASAGNCAAGGFYTESGGHEQAFVATEKDGVWGDALEVPGSASLNTGGYAAVNSISCATPGNCAASGPYSDTHSDGWAFVVSEKSGVWGTAAQVRGTGAHGADAMSISCPAAENCAAGGWYIDGSGHDQAFVVRQKSGVWGKATQVPGLAARNTGGDAGVNSVSCSSSGNCAAGGYFKNSSHQYQAFVASEKGGVWSKAAKLRGATGVHTRVLSVACSGTGNCAAGGFDGDASDAFVVNEKSGVWGKAIEVPGTTTHMAWVLSISCASANNCAAGGFFDGYEVFIATETSGHWGKAIQVAGTEGSPGDLNQISCAKRGKCAAGGNDANGVDAFVTAP